MAGIVVIGGGQAGLAVSHELNENGVDHLVLERGRIGQTWRGRWDSFCLVTPNWTIRLPGHHYAGNDPDGFLERDAIVTHLEDYAASFHPPIHEGVTVTSLEHGSSSRFRLRTTSGDFEADSVVLATGAYQRPHRPAAAEGFPDDLVVIDAERYTNLSALPPGALLIVGAGQTGCQLAEEANEAGREVFLAGGRTPWLPRRIGGHDVVRWMVDTGFMDAPPASLPSPAARLIANPQASGHRRGHDLNYRTLQAMGVTLLGHLVGVDRRRAHFAADLHESVAFGDQRYADFCQLIRKTCAARGLPTPDCPVPDPFIANPPDSIPLGGLGAVIVTSGFRPDYARWVQFPAFDEMGFPIQEDGASLVVPGLYFVGVHFLRKRKSSLLLGVGEDATVVARSLARERDSTATAHMLKGV
ncbi:MAG TPA: NAD(P)-binding domain-containing protein [Candidatus Dormibacteraeota bacterium]